MMAIVMAKRRIGAIRQSRRPVGSHAGISLMSYRINLFNADILIGHKTCILLMDTRSFTKTGKFRANAKNRWRHGGFIAATNVPDDA
jgi:hypothetical protein